MKEVAIIRLLVDEETGKYTGYNVWQDPKHDVRELLEAALRINKEEA